MRWRLKSSLKRILFPPQVFTAVFAVFELGSVAAVFIFDIQHPILRYGSYLLSAYALIISVAAAVKIVRKHPIREKLRSTKFGEKYLSDLRFRYKISLAVGLIINIIYIIIKLFSGIFYRSAWFVSLAVYYILLAGMRFLLLRRFNARDEAVELRRYRLCGIMLLFMNQALAGIVIFIVQQDRGFEYPGILIYAMAAYSFYAVTVSTVEIVKTRRHNNKSPILSAAKAINPVAAPVSVLSLETAMLAQFGGDDDPLFRKVITAAAGGGVCTVVICMAVYMIIRASIELKKIKNVKS